MLTQGSLTVGRIQENETLRGPLNVLGLQTKFQQRAVIEIVSIKGNCR